jgi:mono/diheme cytochrome c family protein
MRPLMIALMFLFPLFQAGLVSAQGNAEAGKKLWESVDARCRDCHGINGEGGYGPDLAGRHLSFEQFKRAVRQPWGVMPAFPESQHSDQELRDFFAHFTSLPRVSEPGPWRTPVPANAPRGQELLIASFGCGQCHGAVMQGPRTNAGAIGADLEWFKRQVYEHTTVMPEHRRLRGQAPARVRMGNFSNRRVPEPDLEVIWRYLRDDLKFRVSLVSRLTAAQASGTYHLMVQNDGLARKGLTAEDITILLALTPGTKVTNTTGPGYQGVRNDPEFKAQVAVWRLPRLGPKQDQTYTLIVASGGAIANGVVRWTKPASGTGSPEHVNVAMQPPPRIN